ncbi:alpha-1-acid glycoprotein 1-like [Tamandua tetradactyla]|uniref:alpha-1-acid glycoprotein 1-like n=1 Tax=Tamandua tetradactyla TaxID=48850 RepID=UPI004054765E
MALPWALAVLSLLPLLSARSPVCDHLEAAPITNTTLQRLSGKWFYIAAVLRNSEYQNESRGIEADFFYMTPNLTEDSLLFRQYLTMGHRCIYNVSSGNIQRQNGTLSQIVQDREHFANLWLTKDPETFMFLFFPEDEQNRGLSFYARKPEVTKEQLREFHEALTCVGLQDDEILYTDGKKDQCGPLEKQQEEERKKENTES